MHLMDASAYFRGKKVTLMGLGLLGRGIGDARFLATAGAELIVTDMKSAEALQPALDALAGLPITFHLGEHRLEDFRDRDLVLVAPKTPIDSPYVGAARASGAHVTMSAALASRSARGAGIPIVGVTGTRGKTTTTEMIAAILRRAGKDVHVGGNIRGVSTLALLPALTPDSVLVLELDSWQLQGFRDEKISPDIAVFTTFYPDHLDYYSSMDAYLADKASIFTHLPADGTLVLGPQVADIVTEHYGRELSAHTVRALPYDGELRIPGMHNRENAGCAFETARALMIPDTVSAAALAAFDGVTGRLALIREKNGVRFYNDTTATTPDATLAALRALDPDGTRNIVLIMGGSDKGLDMNRLLIELPQYVKRIIMLAGTGTSRILEFVPDASVFDSLQAAVEEAARTAGPGDIVLLSPAFASFGMFQNEYDRGDQYAALVGAL